MSDKIPFAVVQEEVVQPKGGLIVEDPLQQDHVLGATGPEFDIQCPDGHWADYAPAPELQRNRHGDTFMCVSFSKNNILEFLAKKQFGETIDLSDIFLGSGSGTVRGRGNSKRTVAEWQRLNGAAMEADYPYTSETTLEQAYAPLTASLLAKGRRFLETHELFYKWLDGNSPNALLAGLRHSPLQVDVSGSYLVGPDGYVTWSGAGYDHEVALFDYEMGKCWWVFDSETQQYLKFAWGYPFGAPMVHALKKKPSPARIFKLKGGPAMAVKHFSEGSLIAFSGGSMDGWDLFRSLYGTQAMPEVEEVEEWPYPVRHLINTNPTNL